MERTGFFGTRVHLSSRLCDLSRRVAGTVESGVLFFICAALAGSFCIGCRSTEESGKRALVSVNLRNNTPSQIEAAANAVFEKNGYRAGEGKPGLLVYEKKGSKMNNFAYGSWINDEPVWIRVKLSLMQVGDGEFRVDCNPVLVQDRGGATEEEIKINKLHRGRYRDLLNELAARLGQGSAKPK